MRFYLFLCGCVFTSPGHMPKGGIAGSHGNSVFNLLRARRAVFQSRHEGSQARHLLSCQHLSAVFLVIAILVWGDSGILLWC